MKDTEQLKPAGEMAVVRDHKMHVYRAGDTRKPKLVFMSGSGTVAPALDFKILYQKLEADFRIIVIEKFGYGYSDLFDAPADIDSLVSYYRQALEDLGEQGPFILLPHSLSGLEAIRWRQTFPEEIKAVIGLDMAVPAQYISWGQEGVDKKIEQIYKFQKLHRKGLMFWYPLNKRGLDKEEIKQQKLLWKRNGMNDCFISEAREVLENAMLVDKGNAPDCPVLMFVSDGRQVSANWIEFQNEFAKNNNAKMIRLNCGHYIHYYESEKISSEITRFLSSI